MFFSLHFVIFKRNVQYMFNLKHILSWFIVNMANFSSKDTAYFHISGLSKWASKVDQNLVQFCRDSTFDQHFLCLFFWCTNIIKSYKYCGFFKK